MPEAGRQDYDQLIEFRQAKSPGEPFFIIFAHDDLGGDAVRAWASLAHARGVPAAQVESALQQADAMDAWPDKRLPNADHLSADQQQQLTYQLSRRAWQARQDCADIRVMLAEERGLTAALGRVRPLLNAFLAGCETQPDGTVVYTPPKAGQEDPSNDPLIGLQRLEAVLRSHWPKSPNAAVTIPMLAQIAYETRTGYPRAIASMMWVASWPQLDPLTQQEEIHAVEAVLRACYVPTAIQEAVDA